MDEMPLAILDNPDGLKEFFRHEAGINSIIADLPEVIFWLYTLPRYGAECGRSRKSQADISNTPGTLIAVRKSPGAERRALSGPPPPASRNFGLTVLRIPLRGTRLQHALDLGCLCDSAGLTARARPEARPETRAANLTVNHEDGREPKTRTIKDAALRGTKQRTKPCAFHGERESTREYERTCADCGHAWRVPRWAAHPHIQGLPMQRGGVQQTADAVIAVNAELAERASVFRVCPECNSVDTLSERSDPEPMASWDLSPAGA
jgi:hypothetical protein